MLTSNWAMVYKDMFVSLFYGLASESGFDTKVWGMGWNGPEVRWRLHSDFRQSERREARCSIWVPNPVSPADLQLPYLSGKTEWTFRRLEGNLTASNLVNNHFTLFTFFTSTGLFIDPMAPTVLQMCCCLFSPGKRVMHWYCCCHFLEKLFKGSECWWVDAGKHLVVLFM